jgi:hypothetical protein
VRERECEPGHCARFMLLSQRTRLTSTSVYRHTTQGLPATPRPGGRLCAAAFTVSTSLAKHERRKQINSGKWSSGPDCLRSQIKPVGVRATDDQRQISQSGVNELYVQILRSSRRWYSSAVRSKRPVRPLAP